jgi:hypothetical protein
LQLNKDGFVGGTTDTLSGNIGGDREQDGLGGNDRSISFEH